MTCISWYWPAVATSHEETSYGLGSDTKETPTTEAFAIPTLLLIKSPLPVRLLVDGVPANKEYELCCGLAALNTTPKRYAEETKGLFTGQAMYGGA
jgi:hypothetical protein